MPVIRAHPSIFEPLVVARGVAHVPAHAAHIISPGPFLQKRKDEVRHVRVRQYLQQRSPRDR